MDITTAEVIKALLIAVPPTLMGLAAVIVALRTGRAVDGMKTELVTAKVSEADAKATLREKATAEHKTAAAAQAVLQAQTTVPPAAKPPLAPQKPDTPPQN